MHRRTSLLAICLVALAILPACSHTDYAATGPREYDPRPKDHIIDIYIPDNAPAAAYADLKDRHDPSELPDGAFEVGRIELQRSTWAGLYGSARQLARKLGGDALLLNGFGKGDGPGIGTGIGIGPIGVGVGKSTKQPTAAFRVYRYPESDTESES